MTSFGVIFSGVGLEHFDIMLVNLYSATLVTHFIPTSSGQAQLILGFLAYGISFVFRPLGAALFGLMGDLVGRKPSMLVSLCLMSVATLGLGLIPSYQRIGFFSTLLFVLCRIVQGLCVGGEYGAAMTYAYESTTKWRTLAGAVVISATHVGGFAAACLATVFQAQFQSGFLIAGILGLLSLLLRSYLVESRPRPSHRASIRDLLRLSLKEKSAYLRAFIIASALVFPFYTSLIYINEVLIQNGLAQRIQIFRSSGLILAMWILLAPVVGFGVDQFQISYRKVMIFGAVGVGLLIGPLIAFAGTLDRFDVWVAVQIVLGFFHCLYCVGTPRFLGDQFEVSTRNTGVSLGYALGASFTAALTPLICHAVVSLTGRVEAVAVPVVIVMFSAARLLHGQVIRQEGLMFELFDLRVEVMSDGRRPMVCNHTLGSYFELSGENLKIPDGMTFPLYSLAALLPLLPAKQRDTHPHDWMTTDTAVACPDPHCGGVFRIQRMGRRKFNHHDVSATRVIRQEGSARATGLY